VAGVRAFLRGRDLRTFLASSALLAATLCGAAAALFPWMLRSTLDPAYTLDAYGTAASGLGPRVGLFWWLPAMALAVTYLVVVFRSMRGKVDAGGGGH
jgi:cytochrome d ubiquinol oxidase subunit II